MSERKRFLTTINPDILFKFKIACTMQNKDMNEILELLMQSFSKGDISLEDLSDK